MNAPGPRTVLRLWCEVGYSLHDVGERLALGIAEDAERLGGTAAAVPVRHRRAAR